MTHHPARRLVRTPDEIALLWFHLSREARAGVGLCLLAGLRAAETYRADATWCRWKQKELWVPITKTNTWNRTALTDTLSKLLPRSGPLLTLTENQLRTQLIHASKSAGIHPPYQGPGAFRHHAATWAIDSGHTKEHVKLILSHASGSVTDRYIHTQSITQKRKVLQTVETLLLKSLKKLK